MILENLKLPEDVKTFAAVECGDDMVCGVRLYGEGDKVLYCICTLIDDFAKKANDSPLNVLDAMREVMADVIAERERGVKS